MTDYTNSLSNNEPSASTASDSSNWPALDAAWAESPESYAARTGPNPMMKDRAYHNRLRRRRAKNKVANQSRRRNRARKK